MSIVPYALVILLLCLNSAPLARAAAECLRIKELNFVAEQQTRVHQLDAEGSYFCGPDAPKQFACECTSTTICNPKKSAEGEEWGECGCCPFWVYILAALICLLATSAFAFCFYACFCRGKWWCDGFHRPLVPHLPRRGAPIVIPGSVPLAPNVFRGYRSADFDSGDTPVAPPPAQPQRTEGTEVGVVDDVAVIPRRGSSLRRRRPPTAATDDDHEEVDFAQIARDAKKKEQQQEVAKQTTDRGAVGEGDPIGPRRDDEIPPPGSTTTTTETEEGCVTARGSRPTSRELPPTTVSPSHIEMQESGELEDA